MTESATPPSPSVPASAPPRALTIPAPAWAPAWAEQMLQVLASGTASVFVLHGNTHDFVPVGGPSTRYGTLAGFLSEQMFGQYDLVLHYDLSRGIQPLAGGSTKRLQAMIGLASAEKVGRDDLGKEPSQVFAGLDALLRRVVLRPPEQRLKIAIFIDGASFLMPAGEPGQLSYAASGMLVTVLNWAHSPHLKPLDVAVVLIDERRADISDRVTGHPHVVSIEVPLPEESERARFLESLLALDGRGATLGIPVETLARVTAGLSLTSLRALVLPTLRGGPPLTEARLKALKKSLIEQQCQGLIEFIEPRWGLDIVIGLDAAKQRLRDDAKLLAQGALECLPMGYLVCGPVGTGKSFLMQCAAGELQIPFVMLRNFRSKYVGETEGNLERVLGVLRAMGPVLIVVDEADAVLGDRDQENDPTGARTFAMIATQMADTRYRGRLIWALLTARPDLLPIDLKRQGRAEVHIPLFYPSDEAEIRAMFVAMARKAGTTLSESDVPSVPTTGDLSGSDIEGMVTRAWRASRLAGADRITKDALATVVEQFMPSTQGLEREMQELAAILECTDLPFLPPRARARIEEAGGRAGIQREFTQLRAQLEGR